MPRTLFNTQGLTPSDIGESVTRYPCMAAYTDNAGVTHILYQWLNPADGDFFFAEEYPNTNKPNLSTEVKPRRDMNFQSIPFPVYVFGRPGTANEGQVYTAPSPSDPPRWYNGQPNVKGWPLDAMGKPLTASSIAGARYAAGTVYESQYNPPNAMVPAGGAGMVKGDWKVWIPDVIRVAGDLQTLPDPPKPSVTADPLKAHLEDQYNQTVYIEQGVQYGRMRALYDAIAMGIQRAVEAGKRMKPMTEWRQYIRPAIDGFYALRAAPKRPTLTVDPRKNTTLITGYLYDIFNVARQEEFADTVAQVIERLTA